MVDRRGFLGKAGWAAAGVAAMQVPWGAATAASSAGAGTSPNTWPPYRNALAIDGLGGVDAFYLDETDPLMLRALQDVRDSGLTAVVMTAAPQGRFWLDDAALAATRKRIDDWKACIARHPDLLLHVQSGGDLELARRSHRTGVIFTFQGTEPLGEDLDRIAAFREQGVRVIQLTHNRRNLVGDGCLEPGDAGLSNFGRQVVEQLNAQRIVVDLAHGSPRTIREGIAASKAPMLISHTGCRALASSTRLVDDATLKALADRGGVAGIILWPYLRDQGQQTAQDVVRHIEHAVKVCGEDHVGIGTDLGISPIERTPEFERDNVEQIKGMIGDGIFAMDRDPNLMLFAPDLNVANRFEVLAAMLSSRGHSDARIGKILGGNFARVMSEVWG